MEGDALEGKKAWNGDAQLELKLFDNSWRVQIADITDELLEKLKKDNGNSEASKKDVVDAWNRQDLTKGGFDDAFGILLPPSVAHFVPPGLVVVGDHFIFLSPSSEWIRQQVTKTSIKDDVLLGDNFVLRRATKEEDGKNEIYHLLAKKTKCIRSVGNTGSSKKFHSFKVPTLSDVQVTGQQRFRRSDIPR